MRCRRTLMARVHSLPHYRDWLSSLTFGPVPPLFTNVKVSCLRGIAASLKDHRGAAAPPSLIEKPVPPDLNTSPISRSVLPIWLNSSSLTGSEKSEDHVPHMVFFEDTLFTHASFVHQ